MPNLELHFTEWSASYTPADPVHDSYHSAAYILDKLKKCGDAAQSMSYWTFTDIFEESGPRWEAFHGGFGLINYEDINKPAFYAYQFLNRLGATELKNSDPSSWICADKSGGVQALVWDFTNTLPAHEHVSTRSFTNAICPRSPRTKSRSTCRTCTERQIQRGNLQDRLSRQRRLRDLSRLGRADATHQAQVAEIKSKNSGAPLEIRTVKIGRDGKFEQQFDLRENDAVLITLKPRR